jgi:hypothetical protein
VQVHVRGSEDDGTEWQHKVTYPVVFLDVFETIANGIFEKLVGSEGLYAHIPAD